ncbi:MAG TPA: DUF4384 domain-containing protein [Candidatus Obscuribacterales bacterium]
MNRRNQLITALTMLLAFSMSSAGASIPDKKDSKTDPSYAKGLFREEAHPGFKYWLELNREGRVQRVSSQFPFKTNDKIRLHLTSSIDGYAYILLKSGSRGEKAVLFPDEKSGEDNRIFRGREYVLPADGFLTFDENPGKERLSLVLSKKPIDAVAFLDDTKEPITLIASAKDGSKDLIPTKIYVSYGVPHVNPIRDDKPVAETIKKEETTKTMIPTKHAVASADAPAASAGKSAPKKSKKTRTTTASRHKVAGKHSRTSPAIVEDTRTSSAPADEDEGVTTIVHKDAENLKVDVVLEHR